MSGTSGKRRDGAGVTTGLGALGHDDVTARIKRPSSVIDFAAHRDHEDVVVVAEVHHVGGNTESRDEGAGAALDEELNVGRERVGKGGEQVDAKGLGGEGAGGGDLLGQLGARHGGGAQAAVPSGVRDGRGERAVGDAAHSGQHDGMFDAEELSETGLHEDSNYTWSCARSPRRADSSVAHAPVVTAGGT